MSAIVAFRDLVAWQRAMCLAEHAYRTTKSFPTEERFGLAQQIRKSAVSIPSNIAEGTRHGTRQYQHHLTIALGSHAELDTQCELASRLGLISQDDWKPLTSLLVEVRLLTFALRRALGQR